MLLFFFFKQKTAYEMRISDWSSDVCSSDLQFVVHDQEFHDRGAAQVAGGRDRRTAWPIEEDLAFRLVAAQAELLDLLGRCGVALGVRALKPTHQALGEDAVDGGGEQVRSEEHTSELQSLMRISFAVFC